jgi:uncharacterized delta-60 repeat protein
VYLRVAVSWTAVLVVVALALSASPASATPGDRDLTFGGDGVVTGDGSYDNASLALQPDGRIVMTDSCSGLYELICVVRLLPDGSRDPSFGGGGLVRTDVGYYEHSSALGLALQGDGKIVAVGRTRERDGGPARTLVVRYLPDGRLDPAYGERGIAIHDLDAGDEFHEEWLEAIAVQPDGSTLVAGYVYRRGGARTPIVARLRLDGTLDRSFGVDGRVLVPLDGGAFSAIALEPDGRILVAGFGHDSVVVLRLTRGGRADTTFGGSGVVRLSEPRAVLRDVKRQADGRIVVTGSSATDDREIFTARLLENGALDQSFGSGGVVRTQLASPGASSPDLYTVGDALALQANGKVVVGGRLRSGSAVPIVFVRYEPDGDPDPTFGNAGHVIETNGWAGASQATVLQPDGKIVGAGGFAAVRLLGDPAPGGAPVPVPAPGPFPSGGDGVGAGPGADPPTPGPNSPTPGAGGDGNTGHEVLPLAPSVTTPSAARRVRIAALGPLRLYLRQPAIVRIRRGRAVLPVTAYCVRASRRGCRASVRASWHAAGLGPLDRRWHRLRSQTLRLQGGRGRALALRISRPDARRLRRAPALRLRIAVRTGSRRAVRRVAAVPRY